MNLFNDLELNNSASRIKLKIDEATNMDNIMNVSENGVLIAKKLLKDTLPELNFIKEKVGENESEYIELAEAVALAASGCIKFPISFLMTLVHAKDFKHNRGLVRETKNKLTEATRLMGIITALPMRFEAKEAVYKVNVMITKTEKSIQERSGCFVATFAFEDYNASEVLFLRYYRDNVLSKTKFGNLMIKIYYTISPRFVAFLKLIPASKKLTQSVISRVVKHLQK